LPGQNIIELGFDIDKLTAEKKQVLEIITDLFDKLGKFDGAKFDPLKGGGLGEFRKSIQETGKAMGEYQATAQKYNETITDQVAKHQAAKKAVDDLGASQKENAAVADTYATSQDRLRRQAAENKVAQEQLAKTIKDLKDSFKNADISADEYAAKLDPLLAQQLALKVANADVTKTLTVLEKQFQATGGSTIQLESRLKELQGVYDKLSPEGRNDESGKALLKEIQDVDAAFKALKGDTGRFQDNVGNYSGAFKDAFKVLQDQLTTTKTQMKDLTGSGTQAVNKFGFDPNRYKDVSNKTGAAPGTTFVSTENLAQFDTLANKEQLLSQITERVTVGFKTSRQESRAFQEAATQLGLTVGLESEEFQVFNKAIGEAQNGINDIKAATKFQASDAKLITGLADAAATVAGGFGAAQAAASLWGDENEDLQQQMAKFQQLLVLINGLQAVANGLQAESGGIQLLLSARTNLLNAAKGIQLLLTTRAIQAIAAETAAVEANAVAQEELAAATETGVAAQEAQATAAEVATIAMETEAVAAGEATVATTGLSTALIATGIGAIIVAIGVAVAVLVVKIREWAAATQLTVKEQTELNNALATQIDSLQKIIDLQDIAGKKGLDALQHQLDLEEKSGQSNYAILSLKQKIADKNAEIAGSKYAQSLAAAEDKYAKQGLIGVDALHKAQTDYFEDLTDKTYKASVVEKEYAAVLGLTEQQRKQRGISDKDVERIKDRQAAAEAEKNLAQKNYDFYAKGEEDLTKATDEQENLRIEYLKLTADEQRKVLEEGRKREADARKFLNAEILSDNNSNLSQRLAAIKSNGEQEVKILEAQAASILSDPANRVSQNGLLTEAAKSQLAQLGQQQKQALLSSQDEQTKLKRSYYERDRDASLSAYKTQLEDQIKAAQDLQQGKRDNPNPLVQRPKVDLSDRLSGLSQEYAARRALLNAELKVELDKEGQTAEEKKAIYAKYASDIAQLSKDFQKTYIDLEKEAQEESLREWDLYYEKRKNQVNQNETDQIVLLNDLSEKKILTDREYARRRKQIEDEAALASAQSEIANAYLKVNSTKAGTKERADAEAVLADKQKGLSDRVKQNGDDTDNARLQKTLNTLGDIQTAYNSTAGAVGDILDIGYQRQKHNLEKLEAQHQKAYESDVARINSSTISEQGKAAQLMVLDKNRQAQKEIDDRKSRQIDLEKAQFDKAASIANIALSTSEAIIKFLHDPGGFAGVALSVGAGIIGAAQLAKAISTPLPKYKYGAGIPGRPVHTGGAAEVGDGYEPELIKEPGKKPYWSPATPTVLDLKPYTQVMTLDYISSMIHDGMFVNQHGILLTQGVDNSAELRDIKDTLIWHAGVVMDAARKSRAVIINKIDVGAKIRHQAWIDKNVRY
jgi:hypothetical protein